MSRTLLAFLRPGFVRRGLTFVAAMSLCMAAAAMAQTTWTVNDAGDSGSGSGTSGDLRYTLSHYGAGDTIQFSVTGTITLTSALPAITQNLTIQGPGASSLTISGNNLYQVFQITSGTVSISGLTVSHGTSSLNGGGLSASGGTVSITNCVFSYNTATNGGGAIFSQATMTVTGSTFAGNHIAAVNNGYGGAIDSTGSSANSLVVSNSMFWNNSITAQSPLTEEGGAIYLAAGTVSGSTFVQNSSIFAAAVYSLTAHIFNCTFVLNTTFEGAAVEFAGDSTVTNSTFYGNTHGALNMPNHGVANNNVFVQNGENGVYAFGAATGNSNVYWGDAPWGLNQTVASSNPITGLGSFGGPTQTTMLTSGSAAICAGSAALAVDANNNALSTDQRGDPFNYSYCSTPGKVDAGAVQSNFLTVNTSADSNDGSCTSTTCSLRDAIAAANASGGDIAFASSLNNQTISLGSGLEISGQVNIIGPGANLLTVARSGNASSYSDFTVDSTAQAVLYGLTIANGAGLSNGGGINNAGTLLVSSSAISGNGAGISGGGIYNTGSLSLVSSTLTNNKAHYGGGLTNFGGSASLVETTLSGNTGDFYGGGFFNQGGTTTSANSTIAGNWSGVAGPGVYVFAGTTSLANSLITGNRLGSSSSPSNYDDIDAAVGASQIDEGGNVIGYSGTSNPNPPASAATVGPLGYSGSSALQTMLPLPMSPAICGGLAANLPLPVVADGRGFVNNNISYEGFSFYNVCVDAGAAQTNYTSVAFAQQPANTTVNTAISPSPSVQLVETNPVTGTTDIPSVDPQITLAYSGGSGEIGGTLTQTASAGVATYGDLTPNTAGSGFTLATSVPVTTAGSGTTLNTTSSAFYVVGPFVGYAITVPATAFDGTPFNFTVQGVDANGNQILTPTDQVTFSSTDGAAVLPATSSLSAGAGTFSATLNTSGPQTITVTDAVNSAITATSNTIAASGPATQLIVSGYPSPVLQGSTNSATVTALDASGFTATTFNGTVTITTSDSLAFVSSTLTLVNGVGSLNVTFHTAGTQSISAAYSGLSSTSQTGIVVNPVPTYVVTSTADDASGVAANCPVPSTGNACTLRDAVAAATASSGGNITFDPAVFPATIYVTHGTIALPNQTVITGTSSPVTLDGSGNLIPTEPGFGYSTFSASIGSFNSLSNLILTNTVNYAIQDNGTLIVSNCAFLNNGGGLDGGGSLSVNQSTFSGSTANPAINTLGGALSIANSVFDHNSHGAISSIRGQLSISGSTFSQNSGSSGGAINLGGSGHRPITIVNSTFTGNSATSSGGALYLSSRGSDVANVSIYSSTITGNTAGGFGGGIYNLAVLNLYGSIVAGNTATNSYADIDPAGGTYTDEGGNLVGTDPSGTSSINPMLSALGNYGGLTQTMVPLPCSPAICAAAISDVFPGATADQRGYPLQPAGGYCPSGTVDSGAVQTNYAIAFTQQPSTSSTTGTLDMVVGIKPAPAVSVTESSMPVSGATVTMTDAAGALRGTTTETSAAGSATFDRLWFKTQETGDTFTASLALNPGLPLSLTTTSYPFNVGFLPPVMISPAPGKTLSASQIQTFTWNKGSATQFQLQVGTLHAGATDVYKGGWINAGSAAVPNIPANGVTLYVTLWYWANGVANHISYQYTESGSPTPPSMSTPTPSTSLTGASQMFTWNAGSGATLYQLVVGTTHAGSSDVFNSGWISGTSADVPTIPTNGVTLYVTLWYRIDGVWNHLDYQYTEFGSPTPPSMSSPTPGTPLTGSSQTFSWDPGAGATLFELEAGTCAGCSDVYKGASTSATSANVPNIPTTGGTLHVRLNYRVNGVWSHIDYVYTEATI